MYVIYVCQSNKGTRTTIDIDKRTCAQLFKIHLLQFRRCCLFRDRVIDSGAGISKYRCYEGYQTKIYTREIADWTAM